MNSETSNDPNVNILDSNGEKIQDNNGKNTNPQILKKPDSSDTDYYLNLLANQNKLKDDSELNSNDTSSLSEIIEDNEESDNESIASSSSKKSSTSKSNKSSGSKVEYEKIPVSSPKNNPTFVPPSRNTSTFVPPQRFNDTETKKELNPQEIRMKKIELLRRLSELKTKGYDLSKNYDFSSSIEEMEYEYDLLKSFTNKRNGIKLYKNILLNTVSAIEFMNDKYDPFEFELNGWSEHMSVEADSYDDVLEELYEKYKGTGRKMPPEAKLLMLIVASASAFHFSKSTFKNLPGVDKVLQNNPDMIAKMINPKKESSQFMSEQEINLERQRAAIIEKEKAMKNRGNTSQQPMNSFVNNNFSPFQESSNKSSQFQGSSNNKPETNNSNEKVNIKAPLNVQDILNRLHNSENNSADSDTQNETSSNNDRIVRSSSMNSSERKKGRKKKNIMSIA